MGRILFGANHFGSTLSEIVGHKSGVALNWQDIRKLTRENSEIAGELPRRAGDPSTIRYEMFYAVVRHLLYKLGRVSDPSIKPPVTVLWHEFKRDPVACNQFMAVMELFNQSVVSSKSKRSKPDIYRRFRDFLIDATETYGDFGRMVASRLINGLFEERFSQPQHLYREIDWKDTVRLRELFQSESLDTAYGTFLDQRFIDYLHRNFDEIDRMNWRKFEALAAEYLARRSYVVELGPGRNDDNVDIRAWRASTDLDGPAALLVQCKRERTKTAKVVVKALWADVVHEGASSGLIVTTSRLSPGAEEVCSARHYPIIQADRTMLRTWIGEMRTPTRGVFMGE